MDTTEFERLLKEYVRAVNGPSGDDESLAAWDAIREAAALLGVAIPTGAEAL